MKLTRFVHLLLCVLVVFVSSSGCRRVPVTNIDELVRNAANLARQHADEVIEAERRAAQAARANNINEMLAQQAKAIEAARLASEAAEKASNLKSQIDELAIRNQVENDVLRAQQAANEAAARSPAIDHLLALIPYHQNIDQISLKIIKEKITLHDEGMRDVLKEILTHAVCFTVAGALSGRFPTQAEIQNTVESRAKLKQFPLSDPEWIISTAIEDEANDLLTVLYNAQQDEELQKYKDICEAVQKL